MVSKMGNGGQAAERSVPAYGRMVQTSRLVVRPGAESRTRLPSELGFLSSYLAEDGAVGGMVLWGESGECGQVRSLLCTALNRGAEVQNVVEHVRLVQYGELIGKPNCGFLVFWVAKLK